MNYSVKLLVRKDLIKKDGMATIYLQIILNRKIERINTKINYPVAYIDFDSNFLKPRTKNDVECNDNNLIIGQQLSKINEIFRLARIGSRELTLENFKKEYKQFESRESVLSFWQSELQERYDTGIIRLNTFNSQRSSMECLKKFKPDLIFAEIDQKFLETYKAFMANKLNYDSDSLWTKLKDLRTYLNVALKSGYHFEYPFKGFRMPKQEGRLEYLNEDEFQIMKAYYYNGMLDQNTNKEKSLRAFLFMCYTGLRIGDLTLMTHNHIKHGILTFKPQKNRKELSKTVEIPLNVAAFKLIGTKKGTLFILPPESKMRAELSEIANKVGLTQTCSPHQARHTFATRFLRKGGTLQALQKLLGHESILTTMVYAHVDTEQLIRETNLLD